MLFIYFTDNSCNLNKNTRLNGFYINIKRLTQGIVERDPLQSDYAQENLGENVHKIHIDDRFVYYASVNIHDMVKACGAAQSMKTWPSRL